MASLPIIYPEELTGRTFLVPNEDGQIHRARIVEAINKHKDGLAQQKENIKFRALINDEYEDIVAYNDICDYIEEDHTWDGVYNFREILDHEGPLNAHDKKYKGSKWNLLILWDTGEQTWEPLWTVDKKGIAQTDPVTVAIYAKENDLLDTPGWKIPGLRRIAKSQKKLLRMFKAARLQSFRLRPVYQYGVQVPRNYDQAMEFDERNGNTRWKDATDIELNQIDEYETFEDKGSDWTPEQGYKKIRVHLVYAVKHDGRHKARLVADGHLTDTPIDSVYASVVTLRGVRITTFLAKKDGMDLWVTDIGNAYLESKGNFNGAMSRFNLSTLAFLFI